MLSKPQVFTIILQAARLFPKGVDAQGSFGKDNFALGTEALFNAEGTAQGNTAVGEFAGREVTFADHGTFVGVSAGRAVKTGSDNTFIGFDAGAGGTTDATFGSFTPDPGFDDQRSLFDNVAIGYRAGQHLLRSGDNTIVGSEAGQFLSTGVDNTIIGEEAGKNMVDGDDNVCVGEDACFNLIDGTDNVAVGASALRGYDLNGHSNVAVGTEALYNLRDMSGSNTAVGTLAGTDIAVAYCNTMVGRSSGAKTEYADFNTFVGAFSGDLNNLDQNELASNANTYVGFGTGRSNEDGQFNVIVGGFSDFGSDLPSIELDNAALVTACQSTASLINARLTNAGGIVDFLDFDDNVSHVSALGSRIDIRGDNGVAVGYQISLKSEGAVAIGSNANIGPDALNSIAIGREATVTGAFESAVAIGAFARVSVDNAIALGPDGSVDGTTKMNVGIGTSAPNPFASLELDDNTRGLLLNRLSMAERDALTGLSQNEMGLLIFNTESVEAQVWDGTTWQSLRGGGGDNPVEDADTDPANELQEITVVGPNLYELSLGGGQFSVEDGDSDPTNEIQTLSRNDDGTNTIELSLSPGGPISIADDDNDPQNELQTISIVGSSSNTVYELSSGGGTFSIEDDDSDPTNEIQTLSIEGNELTLSGGGGTVSLPSPPSSPSGSRSYLQGSIEMNQKDSEYFVSYGGSSRAGFFFLDSGTILGFSVILNDPWESDDESIKIFVSSHPSDEDGVVLNQGDRMALIRFDEPIIVMPGSVVELDIDMVETVEPERRGRMLGGGRKGGSGKKGDNAGTLLLLVEM